jgi:hypothetical protein
MVSGAWFVAVVIGLAGPADGSGAGLDGEGPTADVPSALGKGGYPWYDAPTDSAKPVWPPREFDWEWVPDWKVPGLGSLGEMVGYAFAAVALGLLCYVLVLLWRRNRPGADELARRAVGPGSARRIEGLPAGLRPETDDPWSEAVRRRERGDYAGAVVCLFAHQLLTLDRLRQIRLVPGRTGRQLVRAVDDPQFHAWVEPTLRLFEAVYYGHRAPSAEAFEAVWALAEAFERHIAVRPAP